MTRKEKIDDFITPLNPTDPIVVFDPEFKFSTIVVPLLDYVEGNPSINNSNKMSFTPIKIKSIAEGDELNKDVAKIVVI